MDHQGHRPAETPEQRAIRLRNAALGAAAVVAAFVFGRSWQGMPEWASIATAIVFWVGLYMLWCALVARKFGCRACGALLGTERMELPEACPSCRGMDYTTYQMGFVVPGFGPGVRSTPEWAAPPQARARAPEGGGEPESSDVASRLRRLEALHSQALLTEEEYREKRARLLQEI